MSTLAEQVVEQLKTDMDNVYDAGYQKGKSEGGDSCYETAIYNLIDLEFAWNNAVFPENTELVLKFKKPDDSHNACFLNAKNLKKLKLISDDKSVATSYAQFVRGCEQLEILDLTDYNLKTTSIFMFAYQCKNLKSILGALDLTDCTNTTNAFNIDNGLLEDVEFVPNTIKISINFGYLQFLSDVSIQNIIDCLIDLTGQATQTLTFHADVKAKLTEEQIATITSKNWTLA